MKNILLLIVLTIVLASCGKNPNIVKKDLPIEIVKLKEMNNFDTILQIQSNEKLYYFDQKEEYIGSIEKENVYMTVFLVSIILFFILGFVSAAAIFN